MESHPAFVAPRRVGTHLAWGRPGTKCCATWRF
jgi:hypothetical protein